MRLNFILDRDGVINFDSKNYIRSPDDWVPIPGSLEAIVSLKQAGHKVFVATNQSGVGRQYFTLETLHEIHQKFKAKLLSLSPRIPTEIDAIYFCPHNPDEGCQCRKPKPGMLLQIIKDFNLKPEQTYYIGDSKTDLLAAQAAGVHPILVLTGNGLETQETSDLSNIAVYDNLACFAASISS